MSPFSVSPPFAQTPTSSNPRQLCPANLNGPAIGFMPSSDGTLSGTFGWGYPATETVATAYLTNGCPSTGE